MQLFRGVSDRFRTFSVESFASAGLLDNLRLCELPERVLPTFQRYQKKTLQENTAAHCADNTSLTLIVGDKGQGTRASLTGLNTLRSRENICCNQDYHPSDMYPQISRNRLGSAMQGSIVGSTVWSSSEQPDRRGSNQNESQQHLQPTDGYLG